MNFDFCKRSQFSNEQTSTALAIFDYVFHQMIDQSLKPDQGLKMLREILNNHTLQRPPFTIFIFTEKQVQTIVDFALKTFLRHFCLYEYVIKPRVELILRTEPVDGQLD
jgi:hypothetical protein